ncbi:DUF551 domain-containing protein [Escherichia coli]|nr:DUF551 domain-containing protein [Escherichia coli]EFN4301249.1 DUF551 domain-containing protein [Escherichia coli]ELK1175317.1 DUF551 domain-containing protein [Escherichia coli]
MTTITKERIKLFIKNPLDNGLTRGEQMELARIALASLEAEPIAWECGENIILFNPDTVEAYAKRAEISPKPLFAAPPVPVVPDSRPSLNNGIVGFDEGWNACRAAMLQGTEPVSQTYKLNELPGNYPVTPDGWISCSERMPDSKTAVLVAREFDRKGDWRMKWATYIPGHPDANDGWIIPGASWIPSHWMPLPEPPQEAK